VGLAAVRSQVAARGGTVMVESRRGVGTCFRFSFPLAFSAAHADASEAESPSSLSASVVA
jgi:chemotaxis protein histidine kinase CheA